MTAYEQDFEEIQGMYGTTASGYGVTVPDRPRLCTALGVGLISGPGFKPFAARLAVLQKKLRWARRSRKKECIRWRIKHLKANASDSPYRAAPTGGIPVLGSYGADTFIMSGAGDTLVSGFEGSHVISTYPPQPHKGTYAYRRLKAEGGEYSGWARNPSKFDLAPRPVAAYRPGGRFSPYGDVEAEMEAGLLEIDATLDDLEREIGAKPAIDYDKFMYMIGAPVIVLAGLSNKRRPTLGLAAAVIGVCVGLKHYRAVRDENGYGRFMITPDTTSEDYEAYLEATGQSSGGSGGSSGPVITAGGYQAGAHLGDSYRAQMRAGHFPESAIGRGPQHIRAQSVHLAPQGTGQQRIAAHAAIGYSPAGISGPPAQYKAAGAAKRPKPRARPPRRGGRGRGRGRRNR